MNNWRDKVGKINWSNDDDTSDAVKLCVGIATCLIVVPMMVGLMLLVLALKIAVILGTILGVIYLALWALWALGAQFVFLQAIFDKPVVDEPKESGSVSATSVEERRVIWRDQGPVGDAVGK